MACIQHRTAQRGGSQAPTGLNSILACYRWRLRYSPHHDLLHRTMRLCEVGIVCSSPCHRMLSLGPSLSVLSFFYQLTVASGRTHKDSLRGVQVPGVLPESVKCSPCKHGDLYLIPRTHVFKKKKKTGMVMILWSIRNRNGEVAQVVWSSLTSSLAPCESKSQGDGI